MLVQTLLAPVGRAAVVSPPRPGAGLSGHLVVHHNRGPPHVSANRYTAAKVQSVSSQENNFFRQLASHSSASICFVLFFLAL